MFLCETKRDAVLDVYEKTEQNVRDDVDVLKKWLQMQPHLPMLDDRRLENLLIASKFSVEVAKQTVDAYFTVRNYAPEFFYRDPVEDVDLQAMYENLTLAVMNGYTKTYHRVIVFGWRENVDLNQLTLNGIYKIWACLLDRMLVDDTNNGICVIIDQRRMTRFPSTLMNPVTLKKGIDTIMKAYKLRMRAIHFVNGNAAFDMIFSLLRAVMKAKLFQRVHNHSDLKSLHEAIPVELLPKDLEGTQGDVEELSDKFYEDLRAHRDFFLKERELKSDESKRPQGSVSNGLESLHGLDGSFKKLEVD